MSDDTPESGSQDGAAGLVFGVSGADIPIEGDDLLNFPTQYVGAGTLAPNPSVGDLHFNTDDGKMLVYTGEGNAEWREIDTTPPPPEWREAHYAMRAGNEIVGIFKTTEAGNTPPTYTLYTPKRIAGSPRRADAALDPNNVFHPLTPEELHPNDYDTHIAFNTFPVLEVENVTAGGVLLKLPDEPDKL